MIIKDTRVSLTNEVTPGKFAFFIEVSYGGLEVPLNNIIQSAKHFSHIIFTGEPLEQKEDLVKLLHKLNDNNSETIFEIYTDGKKPPLEIKAVESKISYNVKIELNGGISKTDNNIYSYMRSNGRFIFDVAIVDDIDKVLMFVNKYKIKNDIIFISPKRLCGISDIYAMVKYRGFNLSIDMNKILMWIERGALNEES